jgi:hypothetical protein
MSLISAMQANYVHLLWQAQLRSHVTLRLLNLLRMHLEHDCFPGEKFELQIYGSLHHGLFVPGSSKVNIDIIPQGTNKAGLGSTHVLQVLASHLQTLTLKNTHGSALQHPVLTWHRSATRPWMVILSWEGVPVHITSGNVPGIRASQFMMCTLNNIPNLRLTLLHWKQHIRALEGTQYIGPNAGQVSTYALFTILLSYINELQPGMMALQDFEERARKFAVSYLSMVPKMVRTIDRMYETSNLTSRSFLASELARELQAIPQIVG